MQQSISRRTLMRRLSALAGAAVAGGATLATPARAAYPDRVIKIIVPLAPGGPSDTIARLIAAHLGPALGGSVVVENRAGAAGNIGIAAAAKAEPDGYTLLMTSNLFVGNPAVSKRKHYDPIKDFAPLVDFGGSPNVIAANPETGFKTLDDLIAYAKANPGKLNYATPGVGSLSQLGTELLSMQTGIKMVHVPFAGGNPSVMAAVSGTTQLTVVNISSAIALIKEGKLVALAQTGTKRWAQLPDVKTQAEYGIKDADYGTYFFMAAPAATPKEIVDRVAKEVLAIVAKPDVRARLAQAGIDPESGGGPDHLRAKIARELPMWQDVVRRTGITVD